MLSRHRNWQFCILLLLSSGSLSLLCCCTKVAEFLVLFLPPSFLLQVGIQRTRIYIIGSISLFFFPSTTQLGRRDCSWRYYCRRLLLPSSTNWGGGSNSSKLLFNAQATQREEKATKKEWILYIMISYLDRSFILLHSFFIFIFFLLFSSFLTPSVWLNGLFATRELSLLLLCESPVASA